MVFMLQENVRFTMYMIIYITKIKCFNVRHASHALELYIYMTIKFLDVYVEYFFLYFNEYIKIH